MARRRRPTDFWKPPAPDDGQKCPYYKQERVKVCHTCHMWQEMTIVVNALTGEQKQKWQCTFVWMLELLHESNNQTRGAAAATENMRNHVVSALEDTAKVVVVAGADPTRAADMLDAMTEQRMKLIEGH